MLVRQHSETTIPELSRAICERLIGSSKSLADGVRVMYLKVADDNWHRFDFDTQVLFWAEVPAPNPDDDLDEGEAYFDYGDALGVVGKRFVSIEMKDLGAAGELHMNFDDGTAIVFRCVGDETHVAVRS